MAATVQLHPLAKDIKDPAPTESPPCRQTVWQSSSWQIERLSPYCTILASALGLISDGYQNNLMTMSNVALFASLPSSHLTLGQVVFKKLYPKQYTADVSTRVSNALLIGEQWCYH
jgi:hypothetical protein